MSNPSLEETEEEEEIQSEELDSSNSTTKDIEYLNSDDNRFNDSDDNRFNDSDDNRDGTDSAELDNGIDDSSILSSNSNSNMDLGRSSNVPNTANLNTNSDPTFQSGSNGLMVDVNDLKMNDDSTGFVGLHKTPEIEANPGGLDPTSVASLNAQNQISILSEGK